MAIIKVGDTYYVTTLHAEEGMFTDKISEEEIAEVIEDGEFDYTYKGDEIYIKTIGKRRIAVIVVEGTERIRTVYEITD